MKNSAIDIALEKIREDLDQKARIQEGLELFRRLVYELGFYNLPDDKLGVRSLSSEIQHYFGFDDSE